MIPSELVIGNNIAVPMTRRQHLLPKKIAARDSKIAKKIMVAWDFHHDSDEVFKIFKKYKDLLSSQRYWEILRTVWILSGSLDNLPTFKAWMTANKKNRYCFSSPEETEQLESMPESFNVYRACDKHNDGGISWTIDFDYAVKYQSMFDKKEVIKKLVDKSEVFALITRNLESEILILN